MNLFVTHTDPLIAARDLDDKRVIKIALEATQILSAVLDERGVTGFYRVTHRRHPVTLWAGRRASHARWTLRYGLALCDVYTSWTGRTHACQPVLRAMRRHFRSPLEPLEFQNSARGHGFDFSHLPITNAYRAYLLARWPTDKREPIWTGRPVPGWAL